LGTAKVTYRFDSWKEGKVSPSTIELPVVAPEAMKEEGKEAKSER
jgi:hypothetical protein